MIDNNTVGNRQEEQLQHAINDADIDLNLDNPDLEITKDPQIQEAIPNTIEFDIVQPVSADQPQEVGTATKKGTLPNGNYYELNIRKVETCPSCGSYPSHPPEYYLKLDEKPPELEEHCRKCGTQTCTRCIRVTDCCTTTLCSGCVDSYADSGDVLCYRHREDVVEERQLEHSKDLREMQLEEERMHLEQQTIREVEAKKADIEQQKVDLRKELENRRMDLQERIQGHQEYIDDLKYEMKHEEMVHKHELEDRRADLMEEIEMRRQLLDEFEAASQLYLKKRTLDVKENYYQEQIDLQHDQLDFKKQQHRDTIDLEQRKQDFSERERMFQAKIEDERHQLDKLERTLELRDKHDISERELQQRVAGTTLELSQMDQSWMPREITI